MKERSERRKRVGEEIGGHRSMITRGDRGGRPMKKRCGDQSNRR